jgi:hypothetical protein
MRAWLITWETSSTNSDIADLYVGIVSARKSVRFIESLMEFVFLNKTTTATNMAFLNNRPAARTAAAGTKSTFMINKLPHGERVSCGASPILYGRIVTELKVSRHECCDFEILSWREPCSFEIIDGPKIEHLGMQRSFVRRLQALPT